MTAPMDNLKLKFTSGNDVPVSEARITREEFNAINKQIAELTAKLSNSIDMKGHEKAVDSLIAHIERLREAVIGKIDRMQDIAPECGDSAERIIGDFLEVIIPIIESTPSQSLALIQAEGIREMMKSGIGDGFGDEISFHKRDIERYLKSQESNSDNT